MLQMANIDKCRADDGSLLDIHKEFHNLDFWKWGHDIKKNDRDRVE